MNDQELKSLMANVATDRLEYALSQEPGSEEGEAAFKQGVTAFNAYTELAKVDDAHEELVERRRIEKQKQLRDEELRVKESKRDRIVKGIEIAAIAVVAPVVGYACNRAFAGFLCKAEQFETFTSTAGRSLGKIFKFGK